MEELEQKWKNLEIAVNNRDIVNTNRKFWALYYSIYPRPVKKNQPSLKKIEEELLTPDQIRAKCDDIGKMFHIKPSDKA